MNASLLGDLGMSEVGTAAPTRNPEMTPDLQALPAPGFISGNCNIGEFAYTAEQMRDYALAHMGPTLPGAGGGDGLSGMFPSLQSDLAKLTTGARLMDSFENPDWNQQRESLEGRVVAAASALLAHTEAAGMTLDKDGISIRIAPIAYQGEAS